MRIKLDRTLCDGFGVCAKHAPGYFSLDDWGYASLEGNGEIPATDHDAVMRALLDCPVHAIIQMGGERRPAAPPAHDAEEAPEPHLNSDHSEAISGFVR
jgi:ferredoxin